MDTWPNYKFTLGYKLVHNIHSLKIIDLDLSFIFRHIVYYCFQIDIDFKFKFSQCENTLTNYDKIFDKLLSLIKVKVKDPAA